MTRHARQDSQIVRQIPELADLIEARAKGIVPFLVGIAGAPGSGKSTLAQMLSDTLRSPNCVVPMDGFHLDNETLAARGQLERKGAPETFDLLGFTHLVDAFRTRTADRFPTFDRAADRVVPDHGQVPSDTTIVIFEGNYLLLDEPGWSDLGAKWDATVWIDVPEHELEKRLIRRWRDHGLSEDAARNRSAQNDMSNARRVTAQARPATWIIRS